MLESKIFCHFEKSAESEEAAFVKQNSLQNFFFFINPYLAQKKLNIQFLLDSIFWQ
jgi:hypothetical protein